MIVGWQYRLGTTNWVYQHQYFVWLQGRRCAICGMLSKRFLETDLVLDHDHITNEVRGAVCPSCNGAIGRFEHGRPVKRYGEVIERYLADHKIARESVIEFFGQGL